MPSSRTSPAACAGSTTSSRSSSSMPVTAASVGTSNCAADHRGRAQRRHGPLRQPEQPPVEHLVDRGRQSVGAAAGRRAPLPAARTRPGRTGCRRCARAGPRPRRGRARGGDAPEHRRRLRPRGSPGAASRSACRGPAPRPRRPARRSARGAPPGGHHQQPGPARGSRPAAAAPAGSRCRPSAGRRAPPALGARAAAARTARDDRSQARNCAPLVRRRLSAVEQGPRRGRRAPPPTATTAARRRPGSSGRPARCSPASAASATSSAASRVLPMPGSPVSAANAGRPLGRRSTRPTSARQLVVAADHRPRRRPASAGRARRDWRRGGRRSGGGGGAGRRRARPTRARVLAQHRRLQVAQLGARLEPELLVEHVADLAQHVEGVGLPPGAGQRERAQRPQPLPQRVRRGQRLQLRGDGRLVARAPARPRRGPRAPPAAAPRAGPAPRPRRRRPPARRTASRATAPSASSSRSQRPRRSRAAGSGDGPSQRLASRRCSAATACSNRVASTALVGHAQRVARARPSPAPSPVPAAPGPARAPGAARRRRPAGWRSRRAAGASSQSRSTMRVHRHRPAARAARARRRSARCLGVPRSTGLPSTRTSTGPSTAISTLGSIGRAGALQVRRLSRRFSRLQAAGRTVVPSPPITPTTEESSHDHRADPPAPPSGRRDATAAARPVRRRRAPPRRPRVRRRPAAVERRGRPATRPPSPIPRPPPRSPRSSAPPPRPACGSPRRAPATTPARSPPRASTTSSSSAPPGMTGVTSTRSRGSPGSRAARSGSPPSTPRPTHGLAVLHGSLARRRHRRLLPRRRHRLVRPQARAGHQQPHRGRARHRRRHHRARRRRHATPSSSGRCGAAAAASGSSPRWSSGCSTSTTAYAGMLIWDSRHAEPVLRTLGRLGARRARRGHHRRSASSTFPPLPELPEFLRGRQLVVIDGAVLGTDERGARAPGRPARPAARRWTPSPGCRRRSLVRLHMDPEGADAGRVRHRPCWRALPDAAVDAFLAEVGPGSTTSLLMAELRQLGGALGRAARGRRRAVAPRRSSSSPSAGRSRPRPEMGAAGARRRAPAHRGARAVGQRAELPQLRREPGRPPRGVRRRRLDPAHRDPLRRRPARALRRQPPGARGSSRTAGHRLTPSRRQFDRVGASLQRSLKTGADSAPQVRGPRVQSVPGGPD